MRTRDTEPGSVSPSLWKDDWAASRSRYLDWWAGRGLVISMWEHLEVDGIRHEDGPCASRQRATSTSAGSTPSGARPTSTTGSRAASCGPTSCRSRTPSLVPGRSPPCSGAELLGGRGHHLDPRQGAGRAGRARRGEPWLRPPSRPRERLPAARRGPLLRRLPGPRRGPGHARGAARHGHRAGADRTTTPRAWSATSRPSTTSGSMSSSASTTIINVDGEMAFCYFSLWAPGRMAKLQSDISVMISPDHFRTFVVPFIRGAVPVARPLDVPPRRRAGHPSPRRSAGDRRARRGPVDARRRAAAGRRPGLVSTSIAGSGQQASRSCPAGWKLDELAPLLDAVGPDGVNVLMHVTVPRDIDAALDDRGALPMSGRRTAPTQAPP